MTLQPLTLSDKPLFDQYTCRVPTKLSSYAFAPLYVWKDLFRFYWTLVDDCFCVFAKQGDDYFMPIMPMGEPLRERVIREVYDFMLEVNHAKQIARIENVPANALPFFHAMGFRSVLKETEYLYETTTLIQLKGNRYKSKRAACNACLRNYPSARIQPYQANYLSDCLSLYDSWEQERRAKFDDDIYRAMLEDSRHAHQTGIMYHEALGLVGRVAFVDEQLTGYTFGYPLNNECFCVLFEVTALKIKGLAQLIFRELCQAQLAYPWINTIDDSGLENLKRVKLSYYPCELMPSYNVLAHGK